MSNVKQFWQEYRHWLLKLLLEYVDLNKHDFSHELFPTLLESAETLLFFIEENGYCNNKEMASFILRKEPTIRQLILKNEIQITKLKQAIEEAKKY